MPPVAFEAVVFDWYGTLAAPAPEDWWQQMLTLIEDAGARPSAEAFTDWSTPETVHPQHSASEGAYRRYEESLLDRLLGQSKLSDRQCSELRPRILALRDAELVPIFPDVHETLEHLLGEGVRLALCSNWSWDLDRHLAFNSLDDAFEVVVCSAVVGYRKPHPQIFSTLLEALDLPPGRVAFVGDDWNADVQGARAAGLVPVHLARAACAVELHEGVACASDLRAVRALLGA